MPVVPQDTSASSLSDAVQGKPQAVPNDQEAQKMATTQDHQANPGPQLSGLGNLPAPASKEELKKRAAELNKES